MPAEQPAGLVLGVIPKREEPTDLLLSVTYDSLAALPAGATVGTSSLRRKAQLLGLRPDLSIVDLRGNLDTRVSKLLAGQFDAIVVAAAGCNRLGLSAPKMIRLGPPDFLPAAAQGALGLEYRAGDKRTEKLVAFFDHPDSRDAVAAERAFLGRLEGGCQVPIAAHAGQIVGLVVRIGKLHRGNAAVLHAVELGFAAYNGLVRLPGQALGEQMHLLPFLAFKDFGRHLIEADPQDQGEQDSQDELSGQDLRVERA